MKKGKTTMMKVNFKTPDCSGEMCHCFALAVECHRYGNDFCYSVEARVYKTAPTICIKNFFSTPAEAFDYAEKVAEAYPRYGDDRDYRIDFAPFFRESKNGEKEDENNVIKKM